MSRSWLSIAAALGFVGMPAMAQAPDASWAACRAKPNRACMLAEATRSARSLNQATSQAEGLDTIVRVLTEGKRWEDARALSVSLRQDSDSVVVRLQLAAALAAAGQLSEADLTARAIRDSGWRAMTEAMLAETRVAAGDIAAARAKTRLALKLAQGAGPPGDFAIRRIAVAMIRSGEADAAVAVVRAIGSPHWRLRGLVEAAKALSVPQPTLALELLREAADAAAVQRDQVWVIYDLRDVGVAQAGVGDTAQARATLQRAAEMARSFRDQGSRDTFLEVVGIGLAEAGLMSDAVALVDTMSGDWQRVRIAAAAGVAEAKAGRPADAASAFARAARAAEEGRPAARPFLYAHIAENEAAAGFADRVAISLDRMDKAAALVEGTQRSGALATAATMRVRLGGGDAVTAIAAIADAQARDTALKSLVEAHIKAERLDDARTAALAITAPLDRAYPLSLAAAAYAKAGKVDEALALLDAMPPDHYRRVNALAAVAAALDY